MLCCAVELGAPGRAVRRVLRDARDLPGDSGEDREYGDVARVPAPVLGLGHHLPALRLVLHARYRTVPFSVLVQLGSGRVMYPYMTDHTLRPS